MPDAIKNFEHAHERGVWLAIADRSPARYIFELNWRKMPSGPLTLRDRPAVAKRIGGADLRVKFLTS